MTSKRICERHDFAYPSDGQCKWCEPQALPPATDGPKVAIIGPPTGAKMPVVPTFTDLDDPLIDELYGSALAEGIRSLPFMQPGLRSIEVAAMPAQSAWDTPISDRRLCLTITRELRERGVSDAVITRVLVGRRATLRDDGSIEVRIPGHMETVILDVRYKLDECDP